MSRTTFNISLPAPLGSFVRRRVENGYGSVSEYIRELIRNDQKRAVGATSSHADFEAARREKYNSYRDPVSGKWRS